MTSRRTGAIAALLIPALLFAMVSAFAIGATRAGASAPLSASGPTLQADATATPGTGDTTGGGTGATGSLTDTTGTTGTTGGTTGTTGGTDTTGGTTGTTGGTDQTTGQG